MNKKGLIGKIFVGIGIILLIIILIVGITAYQVYGLAKLWQEESPLISNDFNSMSQGNCTKFQDFESRVSKIYSKGLTACKNPIISIFSERIGNMPIKCSELNSTSIKELGLINEACINKSISANQQGFNKTNNFL